MELCVRNQRIAFVLMCAVCLLAAGCSRSGDIVVVTKELKKQTTTSTAVPDEFGTFASASTNLFWVEGTVRNDGSEEVRNVLISFKCAQGTSTRILTAELPSIPAGTTVSFKTRPLDSKIHLTLKEDEEPEIRIQK